MSAVRKELQEALSRYVRDTISYSDTVRRFCEKFSKWLLRRERELNMMKDIKNRADGINLSIKHVSQSEEKGKAAVKYMKSKATQVTADSRRAELENELEELVKDTLRGLEELDSFLDAVEKLAVTSFHVFSENQVVRVPEESELEHLQVVILATRQICPLLLEFKRDAQEFFLPRLQNVEVISYQLDKYIQTTTKIHKTLEKSFFTDFNLKTMETAVELHVNVSDEDIRRMLDHVTQLDEIRMNQHFRMVFLFEVMLCCGFIKMFSSRRTRMLELLDELEKVAVQLDRMNMGAKISSVAGSSVGAVGGVLSIIGLALIPVTAGVSLALTMTGLGLGITSGVNSAVTAATEVGVNVTQQKKAREVFQTFMDDVQSLQDCVDEVTNQMFSRLEDSKICLAPAVAKVLGNVGGIGRNIDAFVDAAGAVKLLKGEEVFAGVGKVVAQEGKALRNAPRLAADIPDVGQAVAKAPLALPKAARAGLIAVNALFIGMDIFIICKDSISLAKGSETEVSKFIRARAVLWRSQVDAWQRMHDSLCEGLPTFEKKQAVLKTPFYPKMEADDERETETETPPDEQEEILKEKKFCVIL